VQRYPRAGRVTGQGPAASLRVLLVAENISLRLSGETLVPYYYLEGFRKSGIEAWAICHARVREALREDLDAAMFARVSFVEDSWIQRALYAIGQWFPYRIEDLIFNQLIHVVTQLRIRVAVQRLIADHHIDVVFEPAPIAPKALSFLYGLSAPVVIGPMSGGMDLPPAFQDMESPGVRRAIGAARSLASRLHAVVRGKPRAAALIVANEQTREALPPNVHGKIHMLFESGVEIARWEPRAYSDLVPTKPVRFIFCSRFVDWKGIRYLVDAFLPLARDGGVQLDLVGDGELFDEIARQIALSGVSDAIQLHGRLALEDYTALLRETDVYVTPSLRECGGMAMLEAMAIGLPVIGVDWGGAAQYTTTDCAILVAPTSKSALVDGLTAAMRQLAGSYALRRTLGEGARQHVIDTDLSWQSKADQVAEILRETVVQHRCAPVPYMVADQARQPLPALRTIASSSLVR
jgi:glycosyltransferase involved in cell wall biosynthesis